MASGYVLNRCFLKLGVNQQRVCSNILFTQIRGKKRWMKAYTLLMERKLKIEGPPPPKPRSQLPNWDYNAEVHAFNSRLKENFSLELLKTAFLCPCYLQSEEERRRNLGIDSETAALNLRDNKEMSIHGLEVTLHYLTEWVRASFPNLPTEGVAAVVGHLTSHSVVCHVARNLGVEELAMSGEVPISDTVLHTAFMAVIGALKESSGAERAGSFIRDFLIPQLIGKDLFEMWSVTNPMGLLVKVLVQRNLPLPEPRLIRCAGASTVLPLFFVGLYSERILLADAPGETVLAAEEEAARVALRKLYGFTENRSPFNYSTPQQPQLQAIHSVSSA